MHRRQKLLLLCFCCIFYCICGCGGFNVTKADIADAWQSSTFERDSRCFRSTSDRPGQFDYFHSSGTPDSAGFQWLLLRLARRVRVRSVTVYGRTDQNTEKVRAQGIEVLLSDQKPTGLTENPPACTASFTHSLTGFHLCGSTGHLERPGLAYKVNCSDRDFSKMTQFVLLRKFVRNETDKHMNFRLLEVEEAAADFCLLSATSCFERNLSLLKPNEKLLIKAFLPCNLSAPSTCSIRMLNGGVLALKTKAIGSGFLILSDFNMSQEMHGALLHCQHSCSDGTPRETSRELEIFVNAKKYTLDLNVTKHWVVGKAAEFTFSTEGSFPLPEHRCWLVSASDTAKETEELPEYGEMTPLSSTTRKGGSTFDLSTKFSLNVTDAHEGGKILCGYKVPGSPTFTQRMEHLPRLLNPVQNISIRLTSARIQAGSPADFVLHASDFGNPPSQHSCSVDGRSLGPVQPPSAHSASSLWRFDALASDNGRRISCQVVQTASGSIVFNLSVSSDSLNVLHGSSNSWTATQPQVLKEGESLSVSVRSVGGNPEPNHLCWLQTADGQVINIDHPVKQSSESQLETRFSLQSERRMNGGSVRCRVSQEGLAALAGHFSQSITVFFPSSSISWSGELLSGLGLNVTVSTDEGNPRPELHCSLSTGTFGDLLNAPEPDLKGRNGGWIRRALLFSRFTEQQAEVTVTCLISQSLPGLVSLFPPVERKITLRAVFPSARGNSPSSSGGALTVVALCCSLAAGAAVCAVAIRAVLQRTRAATRRSDTVEMPARRAETDKPVDPNFLFSICTRSSASAASLLY